MSEPRTKVGVLVINFGEPDEPTPAKVERFLERIFLQNAGLEPDESTLARARQLAKDRTPGLVSEYLEIGGSPLNAQADTQADALQTALRERRWQARTYSAFQFTEPFIEDRVLEAKRDGVDVLVAIPLYPLCGQSTTVAALDAVRTALAELQWSPRFVGVSGWHHHPVYVDFRAARVRAFMEERGLDPRDDDTLLYFSAHGTPIKYLDEGNRYDRYVEEHCLDIAARVGAVCSAVGFQNHTNRRVKWTQPDNEEAIRESAQKRLVVVPVSFMHEQSETLAELDGGLRKFTESLGKEFHRVPVPHEAPEFIEFLADLTVALVTGPYEGSAALAPCRCAPDPGIWCTNGARDLPPSPYTSAGA
jgi:ferrochelatase